MSSEEYSGKVDLGILIWLFTTWVILNKLLLCSSFSLSVRGRGQLRCFLIFSCFHVTKYLKYLCSYYLNVLLLSIKMCALDFMNKVTKENEGSFKHQFHYMYFVVAVGWAGQILYNKLSGGSTMFSERSFIKQVVSAFLLSKAGGETSLV